MSGLTQEEPQATHVEDPPRHLVSHEEAVIHPHISVDSPNFPGKAGPHMEHVPIKVHAEEKSSEENLKTPSEEERESGTTYRPEGAYEYPSFRHPDFNPDTAYDENGIPIHESPGWTPPPTLPGDNRFGKGRNQDTKSKVNGQVRMPQVAKNLKQQPSLLGKGKESRRLAVSVTDPKLSLHPEDRLANNYHGLQDHIDLLEHQKAIEGLHGLHSSPLHPLTSHEKLNLPLVHKEGLGMDNINHRIRKRKAARSGSVESLESLSQVLSSEETRVAAPLSREHQHETARETAYKLSETELKNKEDSAPIEALNPALYSHRNMLQVQKKAVKAEVNINVNLDDLPLHKLPINLDKLAKNSAEVIAVIVSKDGSVPKCHVSNNLKNRPLPPLPLNSPEVPEVYNKKNQNEGRNPALYKHRNMLKISDLKDDGFKIARDDLIRQLFQERTAKRQRQRGITMDEFVRGPQSHTLKGRGRENFNPLFLNEKKLFHAKTNQYEKESRENHNIVKRETKEALNPALYSYQNIFSSNPKQVLPFDNVPNSNQNLQKDTKMNSRSNINTPLFGGGVPVVDEDSIEETRFPSEKRYAGKTEEALNPFLVNFPNMFKVSLDPVSALAAAGKKPDNTFNVDMEKYVGRNIENPDPLLQKHQNIFSADNRNKMKKPRKEDEALNPHLLQLTNVFGANTNQLHRVPLANGKINPVIIKNQKGYSEREKHAVLARYNNLYANAAARKVNSGGSSQIQADVNLQTDDQKSNIARVRRDIEETEDKHRKDRERLGGAKEKNFKAKNEHLIGLGTPGAGRPKSLKRTTKDSEDSFASYFDGVDHNVVEEDESTPVPERTTGENGTLPTNGKQMKQTKRRLLQTNAKILHQLTRKLRPFWRRELEQHNLSPDNTSVEFTNSMEEEMNLAIERKLLSGLPGEETMDQLTEELYAMIERRKREGRSIGHVVHGKPAARDPLIRGVFEIDHGKQEGRYHLQYWPLDDPTEDARVMNGTINLQDFGVDLAHKYASNKILKKILTIKPHYLSHSRADQVLNRIFPATGDRKGEFETGYGQREGDVKDKGILSPVDRGKPVVKGESLPVSRGETKPVLKEESLPIHRGEMKPVLKEESLPAPREEVKPVHKEKSQPVPKSEMKPVLKKESQMASRGEMKPVLKEESQLVSRGEVKPVLKEESLITKGETAFSSTLRTTSTIKPTPLLDEFKKLRETISKSKNISSILLDEIEARMSKKAEDSGRKRVEDEGPSGGGWKLQQRIKDFKSSKPYHPTLPPFVRRWPTFRSKPDTLTESVTTSPGTFSTLLTMRPKYSGARLKPAFFFSDFQRIGTVYPSTPASTRETTIGKLGWKEMCDLLGVGISGEVIPSTISPKRLQELWASVEAMFTDKPDLEVKFEDDEKKYFAPVTTTEKPRPTTERVETTTVPWFLRMTRRTTSTSRPTTTTRRSHLHRIKHHVKKGFNKLLNFFGFGDAESEEEREKD